MCTATEPAAPSSTGQALAMVRAGLGYLAGCDAGSLPTAAQAEALTGLEARRRPAHRRPGEDPVGVHRAAGL